MSGVQEIYYAYSTKHNVLDDFYFAEGHQWVGELPHRGSFSHYSKSYETTLGDIELICIGQFRGLPKNKIINK